MKNGLFVISVAGALAACGNGDSPHPVAPMSSASSADSAASAWTAPTSHSGPELLLSCQEFLDAVKKRNPDQARANGIEAAAAMMQHAIETLPAPADWPPARTAWCRKELIRATREYLEASIDSEARATLQQIGRDEIAAFETESLGPNNAIVTHVMCPAAKPIPDSLEKLAPHYISKNDEWTRDQGWTCLKFEIDAPQRFQYEVKVDPKTQSFDAFARRTADQEIVELSLHGERSKDDRVVIGEVQSKRIAR